MALHTDTQIYKATYELSLLVEQVVANMRRSYKATLGTHLRQQCFDLVMSVYKANSSSDRPPIIRGMREDIEAINLSLRLASDLREFPRPKYARAVELVESIGRQATGWLKHSENALVARPSRRSGQRA